ncbi:hypothetical protein ABPG77_006168 [Micractinium sp. CCAP 211/92]
MKTRLQSPGPNQPVGRLSQHRCQLALLLGSALVLFFFTLSVRLPRHTLLLEEELEDLVVSHLHHNPHTFCHCPGEEGPGGAPRYCRLGLPPNNTAGSVATGSGGGRSEERGDGELGEASSNGGATQQKDREQTQQEQQARRESEGAGAAAQHGADAAVMASALQQQPPHAAQQEHRLAVLIPYRDRQQHLEALLAALRPFLDHQSRAHDVFVVEQSDDYLFNRGLLLNAAALLLQGSSYDYFCFQDVDTIPLEKGNIQYSFPQGDAPLHLTPNWVHPKSNFEDFFGGLLIITAEQFRRVNGFGTQFWGWGREDDNLRERLVAAGMWPPEYPAGIPREASRTSKKAYFYHQKHQQATELRAAEGEGGEVRYVQEDPRLPYRGAKIMSSQPQFLRDFSTGLNTTMFRVLSMQPFLNATRLSLSLFCNTTATPWCQPAAISSRQTRVRHAAAVHAVSGS